MRSFIGVGATLLLAIGSMAEEAPDFNREVRPILATHCFTCHGPDANTRKAKLRLDEREAALEILAPGKLVDSELIHRILSEDPDEVMPPPSLKKPLSAAQKSVLKRWVAAGAPYAGHWAFAQPQRPELPKVKQADWARTPIDRFILERLEQEGLQPAAEANRERLLCRLSLDLTGLPPTPTEVEAFLKDQSPNAYEKAVDRLLASPRYGEHMAVPWLDYSRYADSNGYQTDGSRQQWPWRDWLIQALNANKPFDQFTIEQLAGDMLPEATLQQKVATGFNRNHRINGEGGIIAEEWRVETVIDRVETTGATWLGLTLGCARCHDHKYDPLSQREFYQFFSFFNNVPETGRLAGQSSNTKPLVNVETAEHRASVAKLETEIKQAEAAAKQAAAELPKLVKAWAPKFSEELSGKKVIWQGVDEATVTSKGGAKFERLEDGSWLPSGPNATHDTYEIRTTMTGEHFTGVLLECLPDARLPNKSLGRYSNGNFVLTRVEGEIVPANGKPLPLKFTRIESDYSQKGWDIKNVNNGQSGKGWAVDGPTRREPIKALFLAGQPVAVPNEATVVLRFVCATLNQHNLGRFRLSLTGTTPAAVSLKGDSIPAAVRVALDAETPTPKQWAALEKYYRAHVANPAKAADDRVAAKRKQLADLRKKLPTVMVMEEMPAPRKAFILNRGQYDQPAEEVKAGLPAFLPALPQGAAMNRLGLARWIASPDNPLTARVWVNRAWEHFFGVGLVKTTENFGVQAAFPSHPALLDWLAREFVKPSHGVQVNGQPAKAWDMKAFHKLLVMSSAYRQDAKPRTDTYAADPDNRLLSRGPRFRLGGEQLRDRALFASGLLVEQLGGPSVRPYMPVGVWNETTRYGDLRNYKNATDDGLYRRTMYTIWKRTAAPPSMLLFDAPNREVCTIQRSRTNTPLQALSLLNEVTFVEAARRLGGRMLKDADSSMEARLTHGFLWAVSRKPTPTELAVLRDGLKEDLAYFTANPEAAKKLLAVGESAAPDDRLAERAAFTLAANVLLNLDEFVTRE